MERGELEKMKLDALRSLAAERGVEGAQGLDRGELIDLLAREEKTSVLGRAKQAVTRAAHKVEEKAHELAERIRHQTPAPNLTEVKGAQPPTREQAKDAKRSRPQRASFDIPSSTVHPHADELETLTMARLYVQEGHFDRAIEIYEKLATLDPDDEEVRVVLADLRKKITPPEAAPPPPPPHHGEPLGMLDLEELPETYGLDECEVLYKDPFWMFAYWEVTDHGLNAARAQLGPSAATARLVLRLFTTVQGAGGPSSIDRQVSDLELQWNHGRRYFQAPKSGAHLRIAVGLLSQEGYFAPIAHSSLVRVPYAEPGPEGPVEWMEVVPGRSRGREREPLVIVRRGEDHAERSWQGEGAAGHWEELPGSSKGKWTPGGPPGGSSGGMR
jgi:hypothetical protein